MLSIFKLKIIWHWIVLVLCMLSILTWFEKLINFVVLFHFANIVHHRRLFFYICFVETNNSQRFFLLPTSQIQNVESYAREKYFVWIKSEKNQKMERGKSISMRLFFILLFIIFFLKFGFGANMILPHKVIQSNFYPICDFVCMSHYSCMYIYKVCLLSLLVSDKNDDYQKRCHIHMCVTVVKLGNFWSYEMHSSLQICYR